MKKALFVIAFAVAFILVRLAMDSYFERDRSAEHLTQQQIEQIMLEGEAGALFALIQDEFPDEYAAMLVDAERVFNSPGADRETGFAFGKTFTNTLLRDNAQYLGHAPQQDLNALHRRLLELLDSVADRPVLCGRILLVGGGGLTSEETFQIDLSLLSAQSVAVFRAVGAGRNRPVPDLPASDEELAQSFVDWATARDPDQQITDDMVAQDVNAPGFCAGYRDYLAWLLEAPSDRNDRVIRSLHLTSALQ